MGAALLAALPTLLKVVPTILQIIQTILQCAHDAKMLGLGEAQAIEKQTAAINEIAAAAKAASDEAEKRHQSDPTDDAFDRTFERKED